MLDDVAKFILDTETAQPERTDWGGFLGEIETRHPEMYRLLWLIDRAGDGVLFGNPNQTISRTVAERAKTGNEIAKLLCDGFNLLSPNHCEKVLQSNDNG